MSKLSRLQNILAPKVMQARLIKVSVTSSARASDGEAKLDTQSGGVSITGSSGIKNISFS